MGSKKTLDERIKDAQTRLAQLKAQEKLKEQRQRSIAAKVEKRKRLTEAYALTREQDAHRKIQLGGIVIAAGADQLDPAVLCGALLMMQQNLSAERSEHLRKLGLDHFEARRLHRQAR